MGERPRTQLESDPQLGAELRVAELYAAMQLARVDEARGERPPGVDALDYYMGRAKSFPMMAEQTQ